MPFQLRAIERVHTAGNPPHATRILLAVRCDFDAHDMTEFLTRAAQVNMTGKLYGLVESFALDGVELRCDNAISKSTRDAFAKFAASLRDRLAERQTRDGCSATLSVR